MRTLDVAKALAEQGQVPGNQKQISRHVALLIGSVIDFLGAVQIKSSDPSRAGVEEKHAAQDRQDVSIQALWDLKDALLAARVLSDIPDAMRDDVLHALCEIEARANGLAWMSGMQIEDAKPLKLAEMHGGPRPDLREYV